MIWFDLIWFDYTVDWWYCYLSLHFLLEIFREDSSKIEHWLIQNESGRKQSVKFRAKALSVTPALQAFNIFKYLLIYNLIFKLLGWESFKSHLPIDPEWYLVGKLSSLISWIVWSFSQQQWFQPLVDGIPSSSSYIFQYEILSASQSLSPFLWIDQKRSAVQKCCQVPTYLWSKTFWFPTTQFCDAKWIQVIDKSNLINLYWFVNVI